MKRLTSLITSLLLCAMLVATIPQTVCAVEDNTSDEVIVENISSETEEPLGISSVSSELPDYSDETI